jgi:hypothetical protein
MSSGFVSGGTADNPTERDDEWRIAQAELEAARKAKADLAAQHDGKSLFEILQDNKDKKQAEFEERARYKLHVGLHDDEADYLDSIEEKKRKEEASVKRDTREQLEAFRRQQEEAERRVFEEEGTDAPGEDQVQWAAPGRKRKKGPETSLLKGVKLKRSSSTAEDVKANHSSLQQGNGKSAATASKAQAAHHAIVVQKPTASVPSIKPGNVTLLGLDYASSDED